MLAERDADVLAGTCGIMTPRANPEFAGIGEVATRPEYRGRGIAGRLCRQALDEFTENGGEAVFLGTENPSAARIYHRLGWRRIANSTVYANITSGASPEEYLADYFRAPSPVDILPGDASLRVPDDSSAVDAARLASSRRQPPNADDLDPIRRAELMHGPVSQVLLPTLSPFAPRRGTRASAARSQGDARRGVVSLQRQQTDG